jgi:hypothetical protein
MLTGCDPCCSANRTAMYVMCLHLVAPCMLCFPASQSTRGHVGLSTTVDTVHEPSTAWTVVTAVQALAVTCSHLQCRHLRCMQPRHTRALNAALASPNVEQVSLRDTPTACCWLMLWPASNTVAQVPAVGKAGQRAAATVFGAQIICLAKGT